MNFEVKENVKILIADDNEQYSKLLSYTLVKNNYNVKIATTFNEAIEKVKKAHYKIAIVDLFLGKESGIDLIQHLKEIDPEIIFMIITGQAAVTEMIELEEIDIFAYFVKPFKMESLLNAITEALVKQREK